MKTQFIVASLFCALPLAACDTKSPSNNLADRVENAADVRAEGIENQADALDNRAAAVREAGQQRADAIEAADRNVQNMTQDQRDAIVANDAAAVR